MRRPIATAPALVEPLSERELEILRLMAAGMTNQQIADRLYVVVGTVKVHNHHIFGKLGVSNRVQALARARTEPSGVKTRTCGENLRARPLSSHAHS